jgi:hypothetical protein
MSKALFPVCLYLQPSSALFDSPTDYRNHDVANFVALSDLQVDQGFLGDWVQRQAISPQISKPHLT